jgi:hypothetical protein
VRKSLSAQLFSLKKSASHLIEKERKKESVSLLKVGKRDRKVGVGDC